MRTLILKTQADDHIYSAFSERLSAALRATGAPSETFAFAADARTLAERLTRRDVDAVISFSSLFADLQVGGASIYDVLDLKFLGWQLDHPLYVSHLIVDRVAGRRSIYPNANHLEFLREAKLAGRAHVLLPGADPPAAALKGHADRPIAVLVAATYNGEPARFWESIPPSPVRNLIVQVVERLAANREASVIDAFLKTRRALGLEGLLLDREMFELLRVSFTYVRHMDRLRAVEALADAGLPLTVVGSGWEARLGVRPNVTVLPNEPFPATTARYGEARVVVNLNAGNGGCERALAGMVAGAAVASDYSSTLKAQFGARALRTYDRTRAADIAKTVGDLLEGDAEAVAAEGQAKAMAGAFWSHRATRVLEILRAD